MEVTFVIDDLNNELNWCSPALQIESLRHHLYVFYYVKYKIIGTNIHIGLCMHVFTPSSFLVRSLTIVYALACQKIGATLLIVCSKNRSERVEIAVVATELLLR